MAEETTDPPYMALDRGAAAVTIDETLDAFLAEEKEPLEPRAGRHDENATHTQEVDWLDVDLDDGSDEPGGLRASDQ